MLTTYEQEKAYTEQTLEQLAEQVLLGRWERAQFFAHQLAHHAKRAAAKEKEQTANQD